MHHILKKLTTLLLLITVLASLVGCSSKVSGGGNKDKTTFPTEAKPTNPTDRPETNLDKVYQNATAVTVGDHSISAVELNYFYVDAINTFYNNNYSYINYMLNVKTPLNAQICDPTTGLTWADYFVQQAYANIKSTYALYDAAMENNYTLTEADQTAINNIVTTLELYAVVNKYDSADAYLQAEYGCGANVDNYLAYYEKCVVASAYYAHYSQSLEYNAEDLFAYQQDKFYQFNSYTFATYFLSVKDFYSQDAGTKDDNGKIFYTSEETAAAVEAARRAAEALVHGNYADLDAFDKAIYDLELSLESNQSSNTEDGKLKYRSTKNENVLYHSINSLYRDWVAGITTLDPNNSTPDFTVHQEGDLTFVESSSGSGDKKVVNGFWVIRYGSSTDNDFAMKNVRHILVKFVKLDAQGNPISNSSGGTGYTDKEKEYAKTEAGKLLKQWKEGDATEATFAELANKESDDGDGTTGGLYENIYPGQMVEPFEDWCFAEERKTGDVEIIETQFGYHIMYFVGDTEHTFRDYMIMETMRNEDQKSWYDDLVAKIAFTSQTEEYINKSMTME